MTFTLNATLVKRDKSLNETLFVVFSSLGENSFSHRYTESERGEGEKERGEREREREENKFDVQLCMISHTTMRVFRSGIKPGGRRVGVLFEQLIVRLIGLHIVQTLFEQFEDCSNNVLLKNLRCKMSNIYQKSEKLLYQ
jgi:hypothetical protein